MANIIYKNNRLYNLKTQSYLKFVKTERVSPLGDQTKILKTLHHYRDEISNEKFELTSQELEQIRRE